MGKLRGEHPRQREELGTGLEVVTHRALGSGMKHSGCLGGGDLTGQEHRELYKVMILPVF